MGKGRIEVWQVLNLLHQVFGPFKNRPFLNGIGGRNAVRFRKHNIKGDHRRTGLAQVQNHLGNCQARPGPLTLGGQAILVNIDNPDGNIGVWIVISRIGAHQFVKYRELQPLQPIGL